MVRQPDRTDIALGMFNSPSSGCVLSAPELAAIAEAVPAVVAVKEGVMDSTSRALALHALAPELVIWECDLIAYTAGWLQRDSAMYSWNRSGKTCTPRWPSTFGSVFGERKRWMKWSWK